MSTLFGVTIWRGQYSPQLGLSSDPQDLLFVVAFSQSSADLTRVQSLGGKPDNSALIWAEWVLQVRLYSFDKNQVIDTQTASLI